MVKLVCGVGVNDADYPVNVYDKVKNVDGTVEYKKKWRCPFYRKWVSMLDRCYSEKFLLRNPTYRGASVCSEWLTFSNFKTWMEKQEWEGKVLDKDLLCPCNKVYGPTFCSFVSVGTNSFVTEGGRQRGDYLIGVYRSPDGKFVSNITKEGRSVRLGAFVTEIEAHQAWLCAKLEQAKILAAEQTDPRVAKALIERYENYVTEE